MKIKRIGRKFLTKISTLSVTVASFVLLSGCTDFKEWADSVGRLRTTAQQQGDIVPYRKTQFLALKAYFSEAVNVALALKNDSDLAEKWNEIVEKGDLQQVCGNLFMRRSDWEEIVERCRRNNFFLCSEEVRAYPQTVATIRGKLQASNQRKFDRTQNCRLANQTY